MLANKVSPASLCSSSNNTRASNPDMSGHGLGNSSGGGDAESQQSQLSLFNSGSEPLASSIELFSQPYSSHSQNSQSLTTHHFNTARYDGQNSQEESRGIQNIAIDHAGVSAKQQSQSSGGGHNKYYMRYLSATSLSATLYNKRQQQMEPLNSTPLATAGGRQGETAHSKAAFEKWQLKQSEKLEKQKLIEEVVESTSGYTKELKVTLETLRKEIRDALTTPATINELGSKSEAELLTHSALNQLLQGQTEIKEQLTDLKTLWNEQNKEIAALRIQVSSLDTHYTTTIESSLSSEIARLENTVMKPPCLHKLEIQMSKLSEHLNSFSPSIQSRSLSKIREEDSGLGGTQITNHTDTHTATPHPEDNIIEPHSVCIDESGTDQALSRLQINRKRKSAATHSVSRGSHSNKERTLVTLSQSSTDDLSTPCDIDLTQHSPSGCSQVISNNLQKLKHTTATTSTCGSHIANKTSLQKNKLLEPQQFKADGISSPPHEPVTKRRRSTMGRVSRQKTTQYKKKTILTTPKITRRSKRLSSKSVSVQYQDSSDDEEVELQSQIKSEPADRNVPTASSVRRGEAGCSDVFDDWLDFQPPPQTQDSINTKPIKFQRSSEAAKRRLVITEQMSSTLAGSDSVLRELFQSAPSILSP